MSHFIENALFIFIGRKCFGDAIELYYDAHQIAVPYFNKNFDFK